MARPKKLTLDFFIHSASARHDRRIKSLRRREKNDGYATYYILLEMSCSEAEMKLHLDNEIIVEDIADECGLRDVPHLYKVIESCVSVGLFNPLLWKSERIVFSDDLYNSYLDRLEDRKATAERKQRYSEAKSLQEKIDKVTCDNPVVTQENHIVTQENPVVTQYGTPEDQNYRTTELTEIQSSYSSRAQEKKMNAPCKIEICLPEEKKETNALEDNPKNQDPTPVVPAPQNLKFIDPYQRAMDVRQREPEVKKMMDDREFLKFLIPLMKRWDAYKTSCDSSDARKWVRVAIEPKNDKCDSRWDESRDRYQDFLDSQAKRSQQQSTSIAVQELTATAPPAHIRERFKTA